MHPSQDAILEFFAHEHLPERQAGIAERFSDLANKMAAELEGSPHGSEVTTGLRKLLEAKDCFVRASLPRRG